MKKTAIYIRVSSDRQAQQGDSIPAQLDALRKYVADHQDMILSGEYIDEGISGQKYRQRDELQRLLDDIRGGKIDLIIFTKLDRWFRSVRHYTATQEVLDKYGVSWLAIWEPIYDTTTPSGRLIVNQMMSIAQFEAENTGQRIRQVFDYKVKCGEVLSGSVPHGYTIEGKRLIPSGEAAAIAELFRMYSRNSSMTDCIRWFYEHTGQAISKHSFKAIIKNEKYIGRFRGNLAYCPAIIPVSLFEDCNRKLEMNVKSSQKYSYIFSGLIKCAECGNSFAGGIDRKHRNGKTGEYPFYRCPKHYQRGIALCENQKVIYETMLERYLFKSIKELSATLEITYTESQKKRVDTSARIEAVKKKIDRLKDLYVNELITLDEYKTDRERYEQIIAEITHEKAVSCPDKAFLDKISAVDFKTLYDGFTNAEKRYLWRSIIKEIRYSQEKEIEIIFL